MVRRVLRLFEKTLVFLTHDVWLALSFVRRELFSTLDQRPRSPVAAASEQEQLKWKKAHLQFQICCRVGVQMM